MTKPQDAFDHARSASDHVAPDHAASGHMAADHAAHDHAAFRPERFQRLNDPSRLQSQVSDEDLSRLLDLRGDEDVLDLGSGTGFYTDRIAALTTGTVYAMELQPEMNDHYRERGVPSNVRLLLGDMTALPLAPAEDGALQPASVDVTSTIATWHETGGRLDLESLTTILRPQGRLLVIDWRKDAESGESGPPRDILFTKEEVAQSLAPYLTVTHAEDLGRFMLAVVARQKETVSN
jgi:SAM-dependent methyltransferase